VPANDEDAPQSPDTSVESQIRKLKLTRCAPEQKIAPECYAWFDVSDLSSRPRFEVIAIAITHSATGIRKIAFGKRRQLGCRRICDTLRSDCRVTH
jgi:hypothetical protein